MREESWALRRAREALDRTESELAEYREAGVIDPYYLADLITARDLARAVSLAVENDARDMQRH